ncbi:MAG TPA: peptide chain release factor N(5)-glutamine methyltransferase [Candidatus Gallibacteroides avistercoris]|uniref:Release factor glutamine methyltransferase n=1 Tax=Candidatus Gallibacteroides avistercoris TaxID=2840833 RepID=A0A9D1M5Z9_9BACT|nr:peptide chain release factor N(5)-glutamine methyltransferase [Candidatus Gallibacteroides avistercoris]
MQSCISHIRQTLGQHYSSSEINGFIRIIFESVCGYSLTDLILYKNNILSDSLRKQIDKIVERIDQNEPIQYVLGRSLFCGISFSVTPDVLIPRPETEELVELITARHAGSAPRILDMGTGSGCIAVSLAKKLPESRVEAWDISEKVLQVARKNAQENQANVTFKQVDITRELPPEAVQPYDIIVSNPPYVCLREKAEMERNVLDYEPHLALFVPDEDPLLFYRAILRAGKRLLAEGGFIYFEINRMFGHQTVSLLRQNGYEKTEIIQDLSGNDRMVAARLFP